MEFTRDYKIQCSDEPCNKVQLKFLVYSITENKNILYFQYLCPIY